MSVSYLVPGRECGDCTACCVDLAIQQDGLDKLAGVPCRHCRASGGCAIYEARPKVCRDYNCVWRSMPALDDDWRPDRSGVLLIWGRVPEGWPNGHAVELVILGSTDIVATDRFAGVVASLIAQGVATYLNLPRGVGNFSSVALLNDLLQPALAARSRAEMRSLLAISRDAMLSTPKVPVSAGEDPGAGVSVTV